MLSVNHNASIPQLCLHISICAVTNASILKGACMSDEATGRSKGGIARAKKLSPEQRSEIGRKGAVARWNAGRVGVEPNSLGVTHKGNFEKDFGVDVECYVLDDPAKTAVISQNGMAQALGLSRRGNAIPRFLSNQSMENFVGAELRKKLENPLKFQWGTGGAEAPPGIVYGFDSALLIDLCQAIIAAENAGTLSGIRYKLLRQQSHIILGASAKSGIKRLIYDLAGYSPTTEEAIAAFKLYVQEEARAYESEFPNQLYVQWHRLYGLPVPDRGKPWQFRYLTVRHIYVPLAQSNGKILNLLRALKAQGGDRRKKLFQFLNLIGVKALRMHLGRVLEMAEDSLDKESYERRITKRFGGQIEFDFEFPTSPTASPPPS
jgi:hypothetical protein